LEMLRNLLTVENLRAALTQENIEFAFETGGDYLIRAAQLPILADELLKKADRGDVQMRIRLDPELQARLDHMEAQNRRLLAGIVMGALAISGAILWRK